MTDSLEIARMNTTIELEHAVSWASMVSVLLATEDGETSRLTDGEYGFGGYHAVRGDRCLNIDGKAFMEAAARLVGIRLVGDMRLNDRRGLLDFDAAEKALADTTVGLEVRAVRMPGWEYIEGRAVTFTLVEFWDMLAGIAKGQGEQDIADSGLWCSVHRRWVTQADTHAGCTAVEGIDEGCPA